MNSYSDLDKIRHGDYIEFLGLEEELISRVIDVHKHPFYIEESRITIVNIVPRYSKMDPTFLWTFEKLRKVDLIIIDSSKTKRWLKLIYD